MRMRLFACIAAIILTGCDKDAKAPEPVETPPAATVAPLPKNLLAKFDPAKASVVKGQAAVVGGETQFTLQKGGRVGIAMPLTISAGDRYEAGFTIYSPKPGVASILLGQACQGAAETSSKSTALVAGLNELNITHTFANPQTCVRLLVGTNAEDGATFTIKSAVLRKM